MKLLLKHIKESIYGWLYLLVCIKQFFLPPPILVLTVPMSLSQHEMVTNWKALRDYFYYRYQVLMFYDNCMPQRPVKIDLLAKRRVDSSEIEQIRLKVETTLSQLLQK